MTTKTWSRNMGQLAIDPDETGLVAGYNMVPRADGTIEDLSGNGNHGTINGPGFEYTEIGPSMRFDGVDDYIDCGAGFQAIEDLTISFWLRLPEVSATDWVLNYYLSGTDRWGLRVSADASPGVSNIEIYDDIDDPGAVRYITELKDDTMHHVVAQMDSLENKMYIDNVLVGSGEMSLDNWSSFAGNLFIGSLRNNSNFTEGNISNLKVLNRVWSQAEIQAEYNAGAKAVNWKSDYGVSESTAAESAPGELSNSTFRKESGTWKISTDTIDGKSCKVIECVTAGVCQIPTAYFHGGDAQAAYGTFELWVLKSADISTMKINFISSSNKASTDPSTNGYQLVFDSNEAVKFRKITAGTESSLAFTGSGFIALNTWYKCKITRNSDSEFYIYLDGTLLDISGGGGANPKTDATFITSNFLVLDLDAGDKIGWSAKNGSCAIVKYQGVV